MANQRIRDPVCDLVEFADSELERTLWKVLQSRPFQRLRRVKQLGFSDFVYPGGTHSRFAHSVGVFHVARQLMGVVHRHVDQESKEHRALAAALVHDLGHGPFSHAFEKVGSRLGLKLADHENMSDALIRNGEVAEILNQLGSGFANDVADIVQKDGTKSVQHAVVSSQFDADRLDYIQRDRMMTGTQHSAIDFTWLIANLEIADVPMGVDDTQVGTIETFVLGPKAIYAAEAFVLGLFQLYPTVYFHKATRGAEKIFAELLVRLVTLVRDESTGKTGLPATHPLIRFALSPEDVDVALTLDDGVVWGALTQMTSAADPLIAEFSARLRDRKLYKCVDIRTEVARALDPQGRSADDDVEAIDRCCATIAKQLSTVALGQDAGRPRILVDDEKRSPYKPIGESRGPLDRINIRTATGDLVDLKERSAVVAALKTFKLFRAYVDRGDVEARELVDNIVQGEIEACRTKMQ
jgi:uncharacterized protein